MIVTIIVVFIFSCSKEGDLGNQSTDFDKIGTKLENPYKVSTMEQAFKNLQMQQRTMRAMSVQSVANEVNLDETDFEIETSHTYIKFTPKSAEEEAKLKQDSTMILSN